jgi:hypothetical protein
MKSATVVVLVVLALVGLGDAFTDDDGWMWWYVNGPPATGDTMGEPAAARASGAGDTFDDDGWMGWYVNGPPATGDRMGEPAAAQASGSGDAMSTSKLSSSNVDITYSVP